MTETSTPVFPEDVVPAPAVYFPALDGIRAIAFLMVFFAHYGDVPIFGLGVSLFFVLSGFLITGILWDTRDHVHRVRNFYVRRTLRIFPLYYGIFVVLLLLTPVMHWSWNSAWWLWPAYLGNLLLYLPGWLPRQEWLSTAYAQLSGVDHFGLYLGHFWSLCVEEQFYLLWPWIVFRAGRRALLWICASVVVVSPFARIVGSHTLSSDAINGNVFFRTLPFQLDALLIGGLLALLLRGRFRSAILRHARSIADTALAAAVVFVYCCIDLHLPALHQPFLIHIGILDWEYSLVNALGVALILGALHSGSWTYKVSNLRPLRWLGRVSYGAYVFHDIPHTLYSLLGRMVSTDHLNRVTFLIALGATLVVSFLSFRYFEKPFLRLKERWTLRAQ